MNKFMNDKIYDILSWIAIIVLPALGAFYASLVGIWGLPYGMQVVGTITAVDTLLGAILKKSSIEYMKSRKEQ